MKKIGIYIHIPFCKKKCYYCDFVSFQNLENYQQKYTRAVINEIKQFKKNNTDIEIETIYIGGGTPSYIDSKYIKEIISQFNIKNTKEITIEVNPGTITTKKLSDYKEIGINRLSIGLQSTENEILKSIGRIHTFEEFIEGYNIARRVGFKNINVDLMTGLPNQKIADIKKSIEILLKLECTHISTYSLILEERAILSKKIVNGELKIPSEEAERNMYWYIKNYLELNGFSHYEISNFAKPGYESKHNLDCWNQKEYRGFGIAAHSYIDGIRFSNTENINDYINNNAKTKKIQEIQTKTTMQNEYMLLGLRLIKGVSIQNFKEKFGENPIILFNKQLKKLVNEKLLIITGDRIKLTNKGLDLANIVWMEFV